MKKETLFVVALAGVLAYLYFSKMKKPADVKKDDAAPKPPVKAEPEVKIVKETKSPVTVDDLAKKEMSWKYPPYKMPRRPLRAEIKAPVVIEPVNLIPNIYDRGVGAKLSVNSDQMYASFSGQCSENIQTACRCVKEKDKRYKLDIPQLP